MSHRAATAAAATVFAFAVAAFGVATFSAAAGACGQGDGPTELQLEADDEMRFDKATLEARAGQPVTLTLKHVGVMAVEVMGHNVVVLTPGTDVAAFAAAAAKAPPASSYIPADQSDRVVAHTELIGGGGEASVTFTPPTPGRYPYLCTFPGHFAVMRGVLVVE